LTSLVFRFAKICWQKTLQCPLKGISVWATARLLLTSAVHFPSAFASFKAVGAKYGAPTGFWQAVDTR